MIDAFVNRSKQTIYLVMDLVEGQPLMQFLKTYKEILPYEQTACGGLPEELCR